MSTKSLLLMYIVFRFETAAENDMSDIYVQLERNCVIQQPIVHIH